MATFYGKRTDGNCTVWLDAEPLPLRLEVWNHSPTGFEWGYCGSGPAQLALAMLLIVADTDTAVQFHQEFKEKVVSFMPHDGWSTTVESVANWLHARVTEEIRMPPARGCDL